MLLALCFAGLSIMPTASAKEPAHPEFSLNQSIAKALALNEAVQKASKDVERTEVLRDEASSKVSYIPAGIPANPEIEIAWSNLLASDLTWRMSKKALTAQEDSIALDTCKKYWDILSGLEKVKAAQAALDSAERQLQSARASYKAGVIPQATLIAAETGCQAARSGLAGAQNDLDSSYVAFNRLVGLWPEDRPVLTDNVEFYALQIDSLDYEVQKVMENCPTVWLAQEKVTMQKYLEDMMFYTGQYRPYQARKIEVEQAELDAESAKKAFEQTTRSLYYGVKTLEEAYAGAQASLRMKTENARVAGIKYDAGMITASDLATAEKELADAQYQVIDYACRHAYYKLAFEKPWAFADGMLSGGSTGAAGGDHSSGQSE